MARHKNALTEIEISLIKMYLKNFNLVNVENQEQERLNYINDHLKRFLITLDLIPEKSHRFKLLELGASPYFMTLLVKKFRNYEISTANYFGQQHEGLESYVDTVFNEKYNEKYEFAYRHFNVERSVFPYNDDEFEVVLCCEIIEHLLLNPTHMLYEIHRILKPNGCLIITTPNALRLTNVLRLLTGKNIYDPYSGYGAYGRHNREYSLKELVHLLRECNYEIIKVFAEDVHDYSIFERMITSINPNTLKDNLFVVAKHSGHPCYRYPPELYRSMHNILNVSRSYIIMGDNDVNQIGKGWYNLENWPPYIRWTGKNAVAYLKKDKVAKKLLIKAMTHVPLKGNIIINKQYIHGFTLRTAEWQTIETELPELVDDDIIEVSIEMEKTWSAGKGDERNLGIAVQSIALSTE